MGQGHTNNIGDGANEMGDNLPAIDLGSNKTVVQIAVGFEYTCALLDDGSAKCWGWNSYGQLGQGHTNYVGKVPNQMGDNLPAIDLGTGKTAVQLAFGGTFHTCALLNDGTAKCWGGNDYGQLGQGNTNGIGDGANEMGDNLNAINLGTGKTVVQLVTGTYHTCALLNDGSAKCWGRNNKGQLGQGHTNDIGDGANEMGDNLPAIDLGTGKIAVQLAVGVYHTCALLNDGTVKCWGSGNSGELGQGNSNDIGDGPNEMGDSLPATDLGTGKTAVQLALGSSHTCALLDDGTAKCWGSNYGGKLGQGNTAEIGDDPNEMGDSLPAVDLGTGKIAVQLVTGASNTCALLNDKTTKCWGDSSYGQLGQGNTISLGDGPNEMGDNLPAINLGTVPWTNCQAGEKVAANGTATADRQCDACTAGKFSTASNVPSCTDCVAGMYHNQNERTQSSDCSNCAAGSITDTGLNTGATTCTACTAGKYSTASNVASCTDCLAGSITDTGASTGATTCTACTTGKYSTASNVASCTDCLAGSITDTGVNTGATMCTACTAGKYSTASNVAACTDCAAGSITDTGVNTGATTCTACTAGKYSTASTVAACTDCTAGTYHNQNERTQSSDCQTCTAGSITNTGANSGATTCTVCPAGKYSSASNVASCTNCSTGTYHNQTNRTQQSDCQTCPSGSITGASTGATTCTVLSTTTPASETTTTAPIVVALPVEPNKLSGAPRRMSYVVASGAVMICLMYNLYISVVFY